MFSDKKKVGMILGILIGAVIAILKVFEIEVPVMPF